MFCLRDKNIQPNAQVPRKYVIQGGKFKTDGWKVSPNYNSNALAKQNLKYFISGSSKHHRFGTESGMWKTFRIFSVNDTLTACVNI